MARCPADLHVRLVAISYLLNPDVIFRIYEGFSGGVGLCQGHNAGNILEVIVVFYFHLLTHTLIISICSPNIIRISEHSMYSDALQLPECRGTS